MRSCHGIVVLFGVTILAACALPGADGTTKSGQGGGGGAGANGANGAASAGGSVSRYPLITPPVRAAAPAGFGGGANGSFTQSFHVQDAPAPGDPPDGGGDAGGAPPGSLGASDIKSRFFDAGPTDIYFILGAIDDRISGLNTQVANQRPACLDQAPVMYEITPFGQSITFYGQCYQQVGSSSPSDPGFVQFGQKDGVIYYYSAIGAAWTAAMLIPKDATPSVDGGMGTPDGGSDDAGGALDAGGVLDAGGADDAGVAVSNYIVRAWSGVGYLNASACGDRSGYDDCSYGVIQLQADASERSFEMTVAGIGFGYCGAQLKSDGNVVFGTGSIDMASSCTAPGTLCVAASDVTTTATCDEALTTFTLPALGRASSVGPHAGGPGVDAGPNAAWAPSQYPGGPLDTITLDGTTSDSLYFGPTSPTPGLGRL